MTAIIVTVAFIALVTYGLQRNHARQGHPRVAGLVHADDRDRAFALNSSPQRTLVRFSLPAEKNTGRITRVAAIAGGK